jgi:hypothetical protein
MSLKPLFNIAQVQAFADKFLEKTDEKTIEMLSYAGEYGVKLARQNGNYEDRTGNLRSSIGYVVVANGSIVRQSFESTTGESDNKTGQEEGRQLAYGLASRYNSGHVLILVAGMEYAAAVESLEGYDVLQNSVYETESILKETLNEVLKL